MCVGYVTVKVVYGVASKTATVNNVNLQQCDGSEAQRWTYVSPQSQVTAMKFYPLLLLADNLFNFAGIKWPDLKYEGWLH